MTTISKIGAMGMLFLSIFQLSAQQQPKTVNFKVIHNGIQRPAPAEITVSYGGHSLRLPVRDGKFEISPVLMTEKSVTMETDVEDSHIRLTRIIGTNFAAEDWTLRLAERVDDDYYEWPGPKGAFIPESCILEFSSPHEDPDREIFREHCRSKRKK